MPAQTSLLPGLLSDGECDFCSFCAIHGFIIGRHFSVVISGVESCVFFRQLSAEHENAKFDDLNINGSYDVILGSDTPTIVDNAATYYFYSNDCSHIVNPPFPFEGPIPFSASITLTCNSEGFLLNVRLYPNFETLGSYGFSIQTTLDNVFSGGFNIPCALTGCSDNMFSNAAISIARS